MNDVFQLLFGVFITRFDHVLAEPLAFAQFNPFEIVDSLLEYLIQEKMVQFGIYYLKKTTTYNQLNSKVYLEFVSQFIYGA